MSCSPPSGINKRDGTSTRRPRRETGCEILREASGRSTGPVTKGRRLRPEGPRAWQEGSARRASRPVHSPRGGPGVFVPMLSFL